MIYGDDKRVHNEKEGFLAKDRDYIKLCNLYINIEYYMIYINIIHIILIYNIL